MATLAVLGTAAAYVIFFRILSTAGAVNVLLVTFLVPIGAIILGVVILKEVLRWQELAGMGLIFVGLIGIDGRVLAYLGGKIAPGKRRIPESRRETRTHLNHNRRHPVK